MDLEIEYLSNMTKNPEFKQRLSVLSIYEAENKLKKREMYLQWFTTKFCSWECCAAYKFLKKVVSFIILDPFTELFITTCIVLNTIFMSIDTNDNDSNLAEILKTANYVRPITWKYFKFNFTPLFLTC